MKTKSALFISILNKQNKLRELFSSARLYPDLVYQKASRSRKKRKPPALSVGTGRILYLTYLLDIHRRFCVLLQLAGINIKTIVQDSEIKYVLHMYTDRS